MAEFVGEIICHLDSDRTDLRVEAVMALVHLVDQDESIQFDSVGLEKIYNCLASADIELSAAAAALLTNLLAVRAELITDIGMINKIFSICMDRIQRDAIHTNTFCMLLSNLTVNEAACSAVLADDAAGDKIRSLVELFAQYNPQAVEFEGIANFDEFDIYQHVGSFICNMSRLEDFRNILTTLEYDYLPRLFNQVRSRNAVRRRAAVGSIRSCLFNKEIHHWVVYEIRGLTPLCLPLVTARVFTDKEKDGMDPVLWMQGDKKLYEPEIDIRIMLIECLNLLCQKRVIRDELRKRKVYPVIKNLAEEQEDERVAEAIIDVVNLIVRDEDPEVAVEEDS